MKMIFPPKKPVEKSALLALLLPFFAVLCILAGCLNSPAKPGSGYIPGVYEGSGRGFRGPIYVQVQVSAAGIEDITITGHEETLYPGLAAMEELLDCVLETGSTDVDAISGASFSSRGFLEAVEDALEQSSYAFR